ncbi:MAG: lipid-A-disaccharide synthase, partial [Planctomycetes bacterium]|nr:lipid-A-disaccharide synthase [Planctomycetota bacterium]
ACLHGVPTVVVYQLGGLLSTLGYHNILSVPWIAAANLIAGREVVPEFCFHGDGGWQRVLFACRELWHDGPRRDRTLAGLTEVRRRLTAGSERGGASVRAARIVRRFLDLGVAP